MKFIWFTFDLIGAPIIYKLLKEGNEVVVAQIQDVSELGNNDKPEDPELKKLRLANYDGIFTKYDAKEVLKKMKNITNKDEVFVMFDFNNLWRYSELAQKLGFTKGFFPTKEDYELESDRNKAKDLVKANYPDLTVAEVTEFKTIEEAKQYLEESEDIYVLKGNSDDVKTFVPSTKNPVLAKIQLEEAMDEHKKDYEKNGFILEKMIEDPKELTPEAIFWDGELIATSVDIENKPMGSGNIGAQTGCASCMVVRTNPEDEINRIAFPPIVFEMAKKHKGMFVWDASLLMECDKEEEIDDEEEDMGEPKTEYYFGEFCSCRVGWDSIFAEIMMAGNATDFFKAIMQGKNPFIYNYGVTVRGFNVPDKDKGVKYKLFNSSMNWLAYADKNVFPYEMTLENGKVKNVGTSTDLVVFAAASNEIEDAVDEVFEAIEGFSFDDLYYRPKEDFCTMEYPTAIMRRHHFATKRELYSDEMEDEINEVESLEEE